MRRYPAPPPPLGAGWATPAMRTSLLCCRGTMRAIHGVCNKCDQAFDFTAGLPSLRRVQSQAPSLTVELIDRLRPPPLTQK